MKWSWFGRASVALLSALALGLGMTACGVNTVAYMWVIGQQYNQLTGFKVDDYTGNLTAIQDSPFSTNGSKPVFLVVKPGGRYLYVVNQGSSSTSTSNSSDSGVAVFSVGGDGALTFQQSYPTQGFLHEYAQFDSTGNYLFVLDEYSPTNPAVGAITTFSVDPNTGRLTLVAQTASAPSGGAAPTFLPAGASPVNMFTSGTCLFTLNSAPGVQTVTAYAASSGQLTTVTTGTIAVPGAVNLTSIHGNTTYVVLTDAGPQNPSGGGFATAGTIYPYVVSSGCGLTPFTGAGVNLPTGAATASSASSGADPVYSLLDTSNKYLFVLDQSTSVTNTSTSYSEIPAFDILTSPVNELSPVSEAPFATGSTPVCMVEDPTSKFMYVSNQGGTVTGYAFTNTEGTLENLSRGSTFKINDDQVGCLALSGSVD